MRKYFLTRYLITFYLVLGALWVVWGSWKVKYLFNNQFDVLSTFKINIANDILNWTLNGLITVGLILGNLCYTVLPFLILWIWFGIRASDKTTLNGKILDTAKAVLLFMVGITFYILIWVFSVW